MRLLNRSRERVPQRQFFASSEYALKFPHASAPITKLSVFRVVIKGDERMFLRCDVKNPEARTIC